MIKSIKGASKALEAPLDSASSELVGHASEYSESTDLMRPTEVVARSLRCGVVLVGPGPFPADEGKSVSPSIALNISYSENSESTDLICPTAAVACVHTSAHSIGPPGPGQAGPPTADLSSKQQVLS